MDFFDQTSSRKVLQKALHETGYDGRIWMTSSFSTLQPHSRTNYLCELEKVIQHVVKIFVSDDYKDVHVALLDRAMKKMQKKVEKKFG